MENIDVGHLVYLIILAIAVVGWFISENRLSLGRTVRAAMAWAFLFLGVAAGYGLWTDIRGDTFPSQAVFAENGRVEVTRSFDGHYYLNVEMNGQPVRFVLDTGASEIVLSQADAEAVGLNPRNLNYLGIANTANGQVRTARANVREVSLGGIMDRNIPVSVNGGQMETSLLGMSYLQRFDRLEISNGRLVLER